MAKNTEVVTDLENKNQVVISKEDCIECKKFFTYFDIPIPEQLEKAFDAFIADGGDTFVNQNQIRFWLAHTVAFLDHPVFNDEVFNQVRPEVAKVSEDLMFDRELEKQLTSTETTKSK